MNLKIHGLDIETVTRLGVLRNVLDSINKALYEAIDTNDIKLFKTLYPLHVQYSNDCSKLAKCNYKNPEIKKFWIEKCQGGLQNEIN